MNNLSSWQRLRLLLAVHAAEQRSLWVGFALALLATLVLLALFVVMLNERGVAATAQWGFFVTALFVSAPLFMTLELGSWNRSAPATTLLMRPASVRQKWLLTWLVAFGYLLAFGMLFCGVFAVALAFGRPFWASGPAPVPAHLFVPVVSHLTVGDVPLIQQAAWGICYVAWVAWWQSGLTWFARHGAVKTLALSIAVLVGMLMLVQHLEPQHLFDLDWWIEAPQRASLLPYKVWLPAVGFWVGVPVLLVWAGYAALRDKDLP